MKTRLVAIGNHLRHDDGVALVAARLIRRKKLLQADFHSFGSRPDRLIDFAGQQQKLIVLDAACFADQRLFQCITRGDIKSEQASIRHGLGVLTALKLAWQLGYDMGEVQVYGLAAEDFSFGAGLSELSRLAIISLCDHLQPQ